uniref:RecA family profile 1 domain-containing protein n=1 Tax=Oryza meridionalis TaxID=40149 RepID=A0A0E0F9H0_9ORYZ
MAPSKLYGEGGQLQLMDAERIEEEEECFESIDKLISQGINSGDVKKLQDAGIYTCNGLMMHTKKSLTGIKGLSEAKVDKICEAAEKLLSQGFITGSDLLIKRKSVVRITTGSQALDELLGGGIETLCITEAFGEFRSGKTQLAHTLCLHSASNPHAWGNGKVAYIDTEGTFRPERIVPIAERFGMDANAVLDNIVDSVIALFRVDFSGRGELAERQQKLAQMLSRLTKIAEDVHTNQVIADPGGGMFITDPKKPAGGHVLAHAATIRLMLRKGKGEQRLVAPSSGHPSLSSSCCVGRARRQRGQMQLRRSQSKMQRWWKVWEHGIILSLSSATKSCRQTAHSSSLAPAAVTSRRPWTALLEAGNNPATLRVGIAMSDTKGRSRIRSVLEALPALSSLTLWRMDEISLDEGVDAFLDFSLDDLDAVTCVKTKLEYLEIDDFRGGAAEVYIAQSILRDASCLKNLVLRRHVNSTIESTKKAFTEIKSSPKACSSCHVKGKRPDHPPVDAEERKGNRVQRLAIQEWISHSWERRMTSILTLYRESGVQGSGLTGHVQALRPVVLEAPVMLRLFACPI